MGFCWCTGKDVQHCNSTLDLVAAKASFRVVGTLLASVVDQDSRPSLAAVVAFRTEVAGHIVAVASFLAIGIHPSFVEASRILVVHIAMVASVDRNQVATSLAVGSPSVVGHILVAASSVVNPSFLVVDRTWVTEVDSLVATFLPSLVIAYLAFPFVEEAYRPSWVVVTCLAFILPSSIGVERRNLLH